MEILDKEYTGETFVQIHLEFLNSQEVLENYILFAHTNMSSLTASKKINSRLCSAVQDNHCRFYNAKVEHRNISQTVLDFLQVLRF